MQPANPADPTSGAGSGPYPATPAGGPHPAPAPGAGYPTTPPGAGYPTPAPGAAYPHQLPPGYPPPYAVSRPTNGMAIASLITAIVALFSCSLLGGVAVFLAKRAREEIRATGQDGEGLATAGLVLGWIGVGLGALTFLFVLLYFGVIGFAIFQSN